MNKNMAAPVVNKKFDDDNDDSGVDDGTMNKLIPAKNEFKKMNQVQPAGAGGQQTTAHLRPSMVGSLNKSASEDGKSENV